MCHSSPAKNRSSCVPNEPERNQRWGLDAVQLPVICAAGGRLLILIGRGRSCVTPGGRRWEGAILTCQRTHVPLQETKWGILVSSLHLLLPGNIVSSLQAESLI